MGKEKKPSSYKKYMSGKEVFAYSMGLFGFQAIFGYVSGYQAEFASTVLGASVGAVGVLVLVIKVLSAVFDPIVGKMIDKTDSKMGKFKPMILKALLPFLVFTVLLFLKVPFTGVDLYLWIFVIFALWTVVFTMADVPSQGIAAVLTPEPEERTSVLSIANTAKQIGFSACYVIVPLACLIIPGGSKVFVSGQDDPMIGGEYLFAALLTGIFGCVLLLLIPLWNKERVPYEAGQTYTMKEMFATLKENKPLMLVILAYFLGFGRQAHMAIQVQAANALIGGQNLVVLLGITQAIGTIVGMALCPAMIRKWGEKNVFIVICIYGFFISILSYIAGLFWFKNPDNVAFTIFFYLGMFLVGLTSCTFTLMPMLMTADAVDYYEYQTGKRMEGAAYAMLTLSIKICLALSAAVALVIINFSGYPETVQAMAAGTSDGFTFHTKNIVFFAYRMVPGITTLLAAIPIFKYPITPELKKKMTAELQTRRAAAGRHAIDE